ncbi:hypothetical protein [Sorangium sp. So ce861]|uniref:hypothetical protein n=1 Tax=Sorangium sp. So ce861 TaxID=3133323 RepID=UPI003F60C8BB
MPRISRCGSRELLRALVSIALGSTGAAGTSGCYSDNCAEVFLCESPPPQPSPCDGDAATAPALDECGVFVSEHGDDNNPGTKGAPVRTLQHAIGLASSGRRNGEAATRRVYACGGSFKEAITLPSGVDLWGGRRCDDGGDWSYRWSFDGPNELTAIAPPLGIPLRVVGKGAATSTIFGVRAVAADASASDGKSSIAMIVSPGAKAIVRASAIVAGEGKDGEAGEDASSIPAKDGVLGNDGADACTADFARGALPVVTVCDDGVESTSGHGGYGGLESGGDGASGQPAPAEDDGEVGRAGTGAGSSPCTDGEPGEEGLHAGRAGGAVGAGYLTEDGWIGARGEDGKRGGVGQGGGGGGGSKSRGPMMACRVGQPQAGAAGGSGGSGGCGGRGGKGGGYGGSSIGIVALQGSAVTVETTSMTMGNGGHGGVGGTGQPGGGGAAGGNGGKRPPGDSEMWPACDGGAGGDGGRGGDAGGGLGGHSFGVASVGAYVALAPDAVISHGTGGKGGLAGNAAPGDEIGQGNNGTGTFWYRFDGPEPESPQ